jgi:hypothetical protein
LDDGLAVGGADRGGDILGEVLAARVGARVELLPPVEVDALRDVVHDRAPQIVTGEIVGVPSQGGGEPVRAGPPELRGVDHALLTTADRNTLNRTTRLSPHTSGTGPADAQPCATAIPGFPGTPGAPVNRPSPLPR